MDIPFDSRWPLYLSMVDALSARIVAIFSRISGQSVLAASCAAQALPSRGFPHRSDPSARKLLPGRVESSCWAVSISATATPPAIGTGRSRASHCGASPGAAGIARDTQSIKRAAFEDQDRNHNRKSDNAYCDPSRVFQHLRKTALDERHLFAYALFGRIELDW